MAVFVRDTGTIVHDFAVGDGVGLGTAGGTNGGVNVGGTRVVLVAHNATETVGSVVIAQNLHAVGDLGASGTG